LRRKAFACAVAATVPPAPPLPHQPYDRRPEVSHEDGFGILPALKEPGGCRTSHDEER
jgi:hypothetical protein